MNREDPENPCTIMAADADTIEVLVTAKNKSNNEAYSPKMSDLHPLDSFVGLQHQLPSRFKVFFVTLAFIAVAYVAFFASSLSASTASLSRNVDSANYTRTRSLVAPETAPPNDTLKSCPKWEAFDVKKQGDKDFSSSCKLVKQLPNFEVTLCQSMRECGQGYFLIKRLDLAKCNAFMARSIAWEPKFDAWMKKEIGPDAFVITFSGPQRLAPSDWRHMGDCLYKHPYRLTNTGNYTVSIMHTHDNFEALQERERTWQRVVNQPLLENHPLDVCSGHCTPFYTDEVEKMVLPVCDRFKAAHGVFLGSVEGRMLEREKYKVENYKIPYYWVPLGCKFDQLFELGSDNDCHNKNHSIKFFGDSQVRVSWDITDRRLSGTKEPLKNNVREGGRANFYFGDASKNKHWLESDPERVEPAWERDRAPRRTRLEFAGRDGHLGWFSADYMHNPEYEREGHSGAEAETNGIDRKLKVFDSILFNTGMWPMSGIRDGGHFTAARYRAMLFWIAESLMEIQHRRPTMKREPLTLVWHGLSAFPLTKAKDIDGDAKKRKDWRNPYRLKLWSDIADEVFAGHYSLRVRRINSFDMTLPFIFDSPDGGHFYMTPAVEAETDEILHKLNICEATFP
ncbi:hypothetical protein BC830DRAFT_1099302 [Chytriomyces sp. MP71]|nr:hypothetical protein BC830DRAFT_1099302 [Chytriomyces sp. MP71]